MKLLPSVAFNDFSGSAGNVTARKTGDRTVLSTRTKHSKKKTIYQAATRCRFADTVRGYVDITEEQRQGWISLANNLGSYHTSTGKEYSMTGHNLFVAINTYRKICGKPQSDIAPLELKPSNYIRLDDWWLTPEHIVLTGLGEKENPNDVLYVEMYVAQSPAENDCWDKTVLVAIFPDTDWGDIDLTSAFLERFGTPLKIGQKVYIKACWVDSECGYVKYYSLIGHIVQELSIEHGEIYLPRPKITTADLYNYNRPFRFERLDFEMSPTSTNIVMTSIDMIIINDGSDTQNFIMEMYPNTIDRILWANLWLFSRDAADYQVCFISISTNNLENSKPLSILNNTFIKFHNRTEFFGTYITSE
ncbi:MAG: hypothetical protein M0R37_11625 [Bacteroidales bacterium]|nr:hypothetical protein [Bacteroidales bacterium]